MAGTRATRDPHPSAYARALAGKGLALKLAKQPSTKLGRFVSALGKVAGANINAPRPTTPEGTYGAVANGTTFVDGVKLDDVRQGHLADCFFVASLASVAYTHPELIESAIAEQKDGTMAITLFHKAGGGFERDAVTIDKLVPLSGAGPQFARGQVSTQMWPAWMQKAYTAQVSTLNGAAPSYASINNGGTPGDAFEALTGKPSRTMSVSPAMSGSLYEAIDTAVKANRPMAAVTPKTLPEGAPVHEWHTYSVLGVRTDSGKQLVKVRNPWGYSEPGDPSGGDGIFEIDIETFAKSFSSLAIGS